MKQPAAILVVRRFVEASIKTIPQNDEPRSAHGTKQWLHNNETTKKYHLKETCTNSDFTIMKHQRSIT